MKIAILADIHGNIHSLEAVLEDIERQHVEQVVVNGDLVNRGPNSLAVLERLWGNNFIFTLGNHDDLVRMWVEHDPKIPAAWYSDPFWAGTADLAKELAAAGWIDLLRSFNMRHEICLPGAPRVLIAHGSPRHYREGKECTRHSQAVEAGDLRAVYRLNNEFHDALFAACGNPYLVATISEYAWLVHAIRSYRIADPKLLRQARDEHALMIEALRAGDRKTLMELCEQHILPSKEAYLAQERSALASRAWSAG